MRHGLLRTNALLLTGALLLGGAALAAPEIWNEPRTGMPFVALPKGCFQMGTKTPVLPQLDLALKQLPFRGSLSADETPQHEVCVDAFLMGQYEVRADDWAKVMGSSPPEGSGQAPAGAITWDAAQEFARRLSQQSAGKYQFRLPSEAEWEYACRAGEKTESVPYRESKVDVAWYRIGEHRIGQPSPVGRLKANAWGLHDMLGNVWEWAADAYRPDGYAKHSLYQPQVKPTPDNQRNVLNKKVIRGASYRSEYFQMRCANRSSYAADDSLGQIGLRLVRQP
jgi:formylglycine-generating enzyme required for sulfatase activity